MIRLVCPDGGLLVDTHKPRGGIPAVGTIYDFGGSRYAILTAPERIPSPDGGFVFSIQGEEIMPPPRGKVWPKFQPDPPPKYKPAAMPLCA